ncbi:hypothetical protein B0H19DRAFT_1380082 [Mycena capillaripes]|nr:hypothetical protein B0H19DRAFT_1380082 [Mycena capillaripes]
MHPALQVAEIVDWVVSELDPVWEAKEVAALACTSKIFHETALDALWKDQNSGIMNLIRCMPDDLWESTEDDDGNIILRPCRVVVPSDWDRVLKYAHRIKSLRCEASSETELLHVYEVLDQGIPGDYLLPTLERLEWEHWDSAYSPFIQLFLGPRITSLTLGEKDDGPGPALTMVRQRCPGLTSLVIHAVNEDSEESERRELSQLVQALTHVEFLELRTIDSEALQYLGHLSTLKTLRFALDESLMLPGIPDSSMFSGLREASYHPETDDSRGALAPLLTFLRTWRNPRLNSFEAFIYDCEGFEEVDELYQLLASHCAHDHLTELVLGISPLKNPIETPHPSNFFQHLFCFTRLTIVVITVPAGYDIDDATVSDMARAWPNIEQLKLRSSETHEHRPRCTLLALAFLARDCLRLHEVFLTLDASTAPPRADGAVQETLSHLDVGLVDASPVDAGESVADFIGSLFPNLKELTTGMEELPEGWAEVERLIPGLIKSRGSQEDEEAGAEDEAEEEEEEDI